MTAFSARHFAFRGQVAVAALLSAMTFVPASSFSQTLPTGGEIVSGAAGIGAANGRMEVNQTSRTAIISWEGFSVGEGAKAHFNNGNGATLNRVRGNVASQIDGQLTATGSLYLVNPNGVAVGQNGKVETGGGFVASTLDLSDEEFAKAAKGESYTLTGDSKARVVNLGKVGSLGGDVVLAAREVENRGDIEAEAGAVGLLAGNEVLIKDRNSDDRFLIKSRSADTSVKNTGNIKAVEVELRANGGNVYALAGNRGGIITATGSAKRNGRIFLTADEGYGNDRGTVKVTGTLNARQPSKRAGAAFDGGRIEIRARSVQVSGKLNAHGAGYENAPGVLPPPRPGYQAPVVILPDLSHAAQDETVTAALNTGAANTQAAASEALAAGADDAEAKGDGGSVFISAWAPASDISAASVNVAGATYGTYFAAIEGGQMGTDLPPEETPVPPVVVTLPPVDEVPTAPEAPLPPVEEPAAPAAQPAPAPEAVLPPVEAPAAKPAPRVEATPAAEETPAATQQAAVTDSAPAAAPARSDCVGQRFQQADLIDGGIASATDLLSTCSVELQRVNH